MAIDSVAAFADAVRQYQLLEPVYVNEFAQDARRFTDARSLAQHLLKQNRLTPYQVNQIFQGQSAGLVLGQYRLLERLGEGGMGLVFKARHQTMGRIVAIKVIRKDRLGNANLVKRFHREIQLAASLAHPNVVLAFDADQTGGTHFFAMEYVDGIDLSRLVKQNGPLPIAMACEYMRQAASGLQHAHERGLVHRDIKPGNLLVTKGEPALNGPGAAASRGKRTGGQGTRPLVKILDMGLARVAFAEDEATGISISHDGTVMGTPDFMAPEQAKNSSMVDWRADIYSLGCTFYYLLAGSVPFPGGTNIEKLLRHQMDAPKPVEQIRADVPQGVRTILQRMMAKRMEDRIQSAGEIAHALLPFCEAGTSTGKQKPIVAAASPIVPATGGAKSSTFAAIRGFFWDPSTRRARHIGVLIGLAALLGLLLMSILVLSLLTGWAKSPTPSSPAVASARQTGKAPLSTGAKPPPPTQPRRNLEPLIRYLPDNANNVWVFRMKEIQQSKVFTQNENLIKANLSPYFLFLQPFGIDLYEHVERIGWAECQGMPPDLWVVVQGTFDTGKFQTAMETATPRPRARKLKSGQMYYERAPESGETGSTFLAMPNANTFVFCAEERYIRNVLQRLSGALASALTDRDVQRHLENLDDKPSMYLVVGSTLTGKSGTSLADAGVRSMTCGLQPGDDLQADYTLTTRDANAYQTYRTNGMAFMKDFLDKVVDSTGTMGNSVTNASPTLSDPNWSISLRRRYGPAEIAKMLKR